MKSIMKAWGAYLPRKRKDIASVGRFDAYGLEVLRRHLNDRLETEVFLSQFDVATGRGISLGLVGALMSKETDQPVFIEAILSCESPHIDRASLSADTGLLPKVIARIDFVAKPFFSKVFKVASIHVSFENCLLEGGVGGYVCTREFGDSVKTFVESHPMEMD